MRRFGRAAHSRGGAAALEIILPPVRFALRRQLDDNAVAQLRFLPRKLHCRCGRFKRSAEPMCRFRHQPRSFRGLHDEDGGDCGKLWLRSHLELSSFLHWKLAIGERAGHRQRARDLTAVPTCSAIERNSSQRAQA